MTRDESRVMGSRRYAAYMFSSAQDWRRGLARRGSSQWRMAWHECMRAAYRERMSGAWERLP